MKNKNGFFKCVLSFVLVIAVIAAIIPAASYTANAAAMSYNSGTRHKICTAFNRYTYTCSPAGDLAGISAGCRQSAEPDNRDSGCHCG